MAATAAPLGDYTLSESAVAGYTPGTGAARQQRAAGGNVLTIAAADAGNTITCSITNTFVRPKLALTKVVDNSGGGGALPSAWTLTATGPTVISGASPVAATAASVGAYTLSESTVPGYTAGVWGCTGNATPLAGNVLTITAADAGNTIACTITNTSQVALSVNKTGGGSGTVTSDVGGINCGATLPPPTTAAPP